MTRLHFIITLCLSIPLFAVLFLPSPYYNQLHIQEYIYLYSTLIIVFLAGASWSFACEYKLTKLLFLSLILFIGPFLLYFGLLAQWFPPFYTAIGYIALTLLAGWTNYIFHRKITEIFHRIGHWKSIILFVALLANFIHLIIMYDW
jgi:hypothetical protein